MNLMLFQPHEVDAQGTLRLSDRRAVHIQKVLKLSSGQTLRTGELNGLVGIGKILDSGTEQVLVQVYDENRNLIHSQKPPPATPIQVILSLPRPKAFGRVLESLTELGIKRIYVIHSAKVEKSYWQAHQLKPREVQKHLWAGLEQGADTILPEVTFHNRFRPFVEDVLPNISRRSQKWVAHPYPATQKHGRPQPAPQTSPTTLDADSTSPIHPFQTLAIGPEGGWTDFELDFFQDSGFHILQVTPRILSSETAVSALVGHLFSKE